MHVITRSCVLFLWIQTLALVRGKDCTLQDFLDSRTLFDSNFDISSMKDTYPGGSQVRVGCIIGFSGFFKLLCVEGQWQSRGTKCKAKPCGHPGDAQFADFRLLHGEDFVFGSEVEYACHKGYQMVSRSNIRRCMAEGWDGVVPVCEAQQCPEIFAEDNVVVIGDPQDSNYGNVLRFACTSNRQVLNGSQEIYCDEYGRWSAKTPTCEDIKCPAPEIENGYITGQVRDYEEKEVLHFECDRTYQKQSVIPSKCSKQGNFAVFSPSPVCIESICTIPYNTISRYDPPHKNVFRPDENVTVSCGSHHYIKTPQTTSAVSTCDEDGHWDITPECLDVECSSRDIPHVTSLWHLKGGKRRGIYKMDDTAGYQCQSGYRATSNQAECTRDGWAPHPLCEVKTCVKKEVQNAKIMQGYDKPTYTYGDKVRYVCKKGYTGEFTLTCTGPDWYGNTRCTEAGCNKINIDGATITRNNKGSYRHGDTFGYTCDDGPQQQSITVTCNKGNWEGIKSCTGCDKLEFPKGFAVAQGADKVYYTCKNRYKLSTKGWWNEAECKNREWNGRPTCIAENHCGELPEIPNGELRRQGVTTPPIVQIVCKEGYSTQAGPPTCQNGNWDFGRYTPETLCTASPTACDPPPRVHYAVIESEYKEKYKPGSRLSYSCADGYRMDGSRWIECVDGQWGPGRSTTCTPSPAPPASTEEVLHSS